MDRPLDPELVDLNEEEINFLKLLATKIKGNLVIDIFDDVLKKDMQTSKMSLNNFDSLISKIQNLGIITRRENNPSTAPRPYISISSTKTKNVLLRVEKLTCPKCKKRTLRIKGIVYCPTEDCNYQRNDN